MALALLIGSLRAATGLLGHRSPARWRQLHASPPGFGQPNSDGLPGGTSAVFAAANVMHFFTNKFPGLSARGFPGRLVSSCSLECLSFCHSFLLLRLKAHFAAGYLNFPVEAINLEFSVISYGSLQAIPEFSAARDLKSELSL